MNSNSVFYLGKWKVEAELNRISQESCELILVPKVMKLLLIFAENKGQVISQESLIKKVWAEQIVSDSSLYQAITQLRKALGDSASNPQYIERISGQGYRLIADVQSEVIEEKEKAVGKAKELKSNKFASIFLAITLLSVIGVISQYLINKPVKQTLEIGKTIDISQLSSISLVDLVTDKHQLPAEAEALNDVLLTQLMHIQALKVIHLKNENEQALTEALLRGKINLQKNKIRVFLQLEAVSNHEVIWAKVFEGELNNLFALQDRIVENLLLLFKRNQQVATFNTTLIDKESFDQYLLARHLWEQRSEQELYRSKEIFESMQQVKPLFPLAAVGLCDTYHFLHLYSDWSLEQALSLCEPLLEQALQAQPDLGEAIAAKGLLLTSQGKLEEAEALLKEAIELAPNYPFAYLWYGNLIRELGQYPQALQMTQKAYELSPVSPVINRSLAYSFLNLRRINDARMYFQRAIDLEPDYSARAVSEIDFFELNTQRAQAFLSWAEENRAVFNKQLNYRLTESQINLALGKFELVTETLKQLEGKTVNPSFLLYMQACLAAVQGDMQKAIDLLEQRLVMHPNNERFVIPYIFALTENKQYQQALDKLRQYLPDMNTNPPEINDNNQFQLALYAQLQIKLDRAKEVSQLLPKLDNWIFSGNRTPELWMAKWFIFRDKKTQARSLLLKKMQQGWLPDYNAEIFSELMMRNLFIDSDLGQARFDELISINRNKLSQ